jgi:tRNA pseudouridine38-40 synthase
MNYKCVIEYDGTDFCGWQYQPRERTVQGEFEKAVGKMVKKKVNVTAAGRTDSGVHAAGQVVNFKVDKDWSTDIVLKGLNANLPTDILIKSCRVVSDTFNARFDAKSREYRYRIYNGRSPLKSRNLWCSNLDIDHAMLSRLASKLTGEQHFLSFCVKKSQKESNLCHVTKSCWTKRGNEHTFRIVANRFLHGMVRSLVGTMIKVANGQLTEHDFRELFENPKRSATIMTAPPQGLCLMKVDY